MERQTITVDIAPGNNQIQRLKSSQGDIGRPLGVYIIQNGAALDCSAYTADLYILKPDGNYFTATATVDATEHNLITWETAKQETPVAGDCAAQIRILSNGDDVGTARFVEYVEASPGFVGESSESVVESLMEYVRQAAASAETASGAASSASGSASAASGSASSAASSASAAAGSASTAHTDAETASQAAQTAQDVADSIPEDYSTLSEDVTGLKSALNEFPNVRTPQETAADLYIADANGYVIGKFVGGHIVTKNFDSSLLPTLLSGKIDIDQDASDAGKVLTVGSDGTVAPEPLDIPSPDLIKTSDATQSDFDIADANGYVVLRIRNGNIITSAFNSAETIIDSDLDNALEERHVSNRLAGVKWDALGDSLTAPGTVGSSRKNYTRWIAEKNGMSLNNLGVGGKGYWQGIEDEVAGIRSDTDIVTIFGSFNDITNYIANPGVPTDTWADGKTNYCARARRVFDAIYAIRNDIRIGVILPTPWVNYNCYDTATATQENVENMLDALTGICKIYGIPVLDMYHGSNLRPWDSDFRTAYFVSADGYHPNELGNKLFLAPQIEAFLLSLACTY